MASVSVIIPTYLGAATIPELVERTTKVLAARRDPYEMIFVEDCSPDAGETWDVVCELAEFDSCIRGFRLMRNRGQHNALLLGIREARYDLCVTLDDDLQNPPEEIPRLIEVLELGDGRTPFDVVYGTPRHKAHGWIKNLGSILTRVALSTVLKARHARYASAFRVFRTSLRRSFETYAGSMISIDALLAWGTERFGHAEVQHDPRTVGESAWGFAKMATHAITMITSFSTLPLRAASFSGFFFFLFGVGVLCYALWARITGSPMPGWTFLVSLSAIMAGAQLLTLGIFGEYLARVHLRTQGHPPYTLAETTEVAEPAA